METESCFSFEKDGHIVSIRAAHGHVLVILDQTFGRMHVLREFARIGIEYQVHVVQIVPLQCVAVYFPGSPVLTMQKIQKSDIFGWKKNDGN